jgi:hypothetical protein
MGGFYSMLSDCFKKEELEETFLTKNVVYKESTGLTVLSDLIDNKQVQWNTYDSKSEQEYFRMINDAAYLRKKYNRVNVVNPN